MMWRLDTLPLLLVVLTSVNSVHAETAAFDLSGPRIDVRVTRGDKTLPISQVPNLQPGDRIWLHPDLPEDQSAHYLLVAVFSVGPRTHHRITGSQKPKCGKRRHVKKGSSLQCRRAHNKFSCSWLQRRAATSPPFVPPCRANPELL